MEIEYNIISINQNLINSSTVDANDNHDCNRLKYSKRREYVKSKLLSNLNNSIIFDAVTKNNVMIVDGTVNFDDLNFKVNYDWNTGKFCSLGQISLALSNYKLWKKSLCENKIIVICEDDIFFLNENDIKYTQECVKFFCEKYSHMENVLYLQSWCPWRNILKTYNTNDCSEDQDFYFLNNSFNDLSGTVCYAVTPASAQKLINYIKTEGIIPVDQLLIKTLQTKTVNYLIPKKYQNNACINMDLQ